MTFQECFQPNFNSFGQVVTEEKIFLETNQSETRIVFGKSSLCLWAKKKKPAISSTEFSIENVFENHFGHIFFAYFL